MKIIHHIFPQVSPVSDSHPTGVVLETHYTVENDMVTLTNEEGKPLRNSFGNVIAQKLDGSTPAKIASRLALRDWHSARDDTEESFRRPLGPRDYAWRVPC
jgi:hypothetical protein